MKKKNYEWKGKTIMKIKMKSIKKAAGIILLIFAMLIPAISVQADVDFFYLTNYYTSYPTYSPYIQPLCIVTDGKITNKKSSNPAVAKIQMVLNTERPSDQNVCLDIKKPGSTIISFKVGSDQYFRRISVIKYQNALASVKLGKTTLPVTKFKKDSNYYTKYSKYAGQKLKFQVTAKKGWKILDISYFDRVPEHEIIDVKNGGYITFHKKVKVDPDYPPYISICLMNTKSGRIQYQDIQFK